METRGPWAGAVYMEASLLLIPVLWWPTLPDPRREPALEALWASVSLPGLSQGSGTPYVPWPSSPFSAFVFSDSHLQCMYIGKMHHRKPSICVSPDGGDAAASKAGHGPGHPWCPPRSSTEQWSWSTACVLISALFSGHHVVYHVLCACPTCEKPFIVPSFLCPTLHC